LKANNSIWTGESCDNSRGKGRAKGDQGLRRYRARRKEGKNSRFQMSDLPATLSPRPASRGSAEADGLVRRAGVR